MSIYSHLANRKWSNYLENWDSSDVNNHLVIFEVIWNNPLRIGWQMHSIFYILFILA